MIIEMVVGALSGFIGGVAVSAAISKPITADLHFFCDTLLASLKKIESLFEKTTGNTAASLHSFKPHPSGAPVSVSLPPSATLPPSMTIPLVTPPDNKAS